jgi:transcriptional regulator with XRE-family HTH domain
MRYPTRVEQSYKLRMGLAIRDLRNQLNLSQENLAEHANLHRTYIGAVERGERNVTLLNLFRIATALRTTPAAILRKSESATPNEKRRASGKQ